MAKWVKFTERMPTEGDLDNGGQVVIRNKNGTLATAWIPHHRRRDASGPPDHYKDCFWLENLPRAPKPRTLEDVVWEFLSLTVSNRPANFDRKLDLQGEMREILERKYRKERR